MKSDKEKPSKLALRLAKLLLDRHNIKVRPVIYRTYASRNDREIGGWLWQMFIISDDGGARGTVGSQWPASRVVKAPKTEICESGVHHEFDIDPYW